MSNRLKFQCWNCKDVFSLLLDTDEKPDLISECPYCTEEVLIELEPYRNKETTLFRKDLQDNAKLLATDAFPEVVPTKNPDNDVPAKE